MYTKKSSFLSLVKIVTSSISRVHPDADSSEISNMPKVTMNPIEASDSTEHSPFGYKKLVYNYNLFRVKQNQTSNPNTVSTIIVCTDGSVGEVHDVGYRC